jgi:hypothetical protein
MKPMKIYFDSPSSAAPGWVGMRILVKSPTGCDIQETRRKPMIVGSTQIASHPPPFVQILQEQGKVTQELVAEALHIQTKERKYIGQILCEIGRLNAADIETALTL